MELLFLSDKNVSAKNQKPRKCKNHDVYYKTKT